MSDFIFPFLISHIIFSICFFPIFLKKNSVPNFISISTQRCYSFNFSLHFSHTTGTSFDAWQTRVCQTHRRHAARYERCERQLQYRNCQTLLLRRASWSVVTSHALPYFLTFFHKTQLMQLWRLGAVRVEATVLRAESKFYISVIPRTLIQH